MNITHTVKYYTSGSLDSFKWPHYSDCVTLHHYITPCHHFDCLQGSPVWPNQPLSSLYKSFLISYNAPNFDDLTVDLVLQNLFRLLESNRSRKEFDEVACFDDHVGIPCLFACFDGNGPFY